MFIRLRHIPVHPLLKGYIEKIFVLETRGRVPNPDLKIIVPNGFIKLVIPIGNGLVGQRERYSRLSKSNRITLVGVSDTPFTVDAEIDAPSSIVTVEFSPSGAYHFLDIRHSELKNQIFLMDEILGREARDIEEMLTNTDHIDQKLTLLQEFLIRRLHKINRDNDTIFDYCVTKIRSSHGTITVRELEKATGYSSRWLNMKFDERIGLNIKTMCAITRFQFVFETLTNNPRALLKEKMYHAIYYDQSHFIKEFKRFTGMPPKQFDNSENLFSKIFYKH